MHDFIQLMASARFHIMTAEVCTHAGVPHVHALVGQGRGVARMASPFARSLVGSRRTGNPRHGSQSAGAGVAVASASGLLVF